MSPPPPLRPRPRWSPGPLRQREELPGGAADSPARRCLVPQRQGGFVPPLLPSQDPHERPQPRPCLARCPGAPVGLPRGGARSSLLSPHRSRLRLAFSQPPRTATGDPAPYPHGSRVGPGAGWKDSLRRRSSRRQQNRRVPALCSHAWSWGSAERLAGDGAKASAQLGGPRPLRAPVRHGCGEGRIRNHASQGDTDGKGAGQTPVTAGCSTSTATGDGSSSAP